MLQLELPHINVLSKIDLLSQFGNLGWCAPLLVLLHVRLNDALPDRLQPRLLYRSTGSEVLGELAEYGLIKICFTEYGYLPAH
jgi:hypothetical protein